MERLQFNPQKLARVVASAGLVWLLNQGQEIAQGNTERAEVALTFDCGPWVDRSYIKSILNVLDEYQTKVTFFVSGAFIEKYPDVFERIAKTHEVANHGYYHLNHTELSREDQLLELNRTEELANSFGVSTKPLWRPPFGSRNNSVKDIAHEAGYPLTIMWALDSGDWIADKSAQAVKETVLNNLGYGYIIVMHCNSHQTSQQIQSIMWHLDSWKIKVVPVSRIIQ